MQSIAASLVLMVTLVVGAGITSASPPGEQIAYRDAAATWLAAQVTPEGAIVSPYTGNPSPSVTAQAILGLAGSGAAPETVDSMMAYLAEYVTDNLGSAGIDDNPGVLAYLILDAIATGNDPHAFGGADLVVLLQATQRTDASAPDFGLFGTSDPTYDGVFRQSIALLALDATGSANPDGVAWLQGQQCDDGGFVSYRADTTVPCPAVDPTTFSGADTNSTSMAAMALDATGDVTGAGQAISWLEGVQTASGGFAYLGDATLQMDANSTGLALTALTTVNGMPDADAVAALASLQVPSTGDPADVGGIAFQPQAGVLVPNLMATSQALWGLAGRSFPFTPLPPEQTPTTVTTTVPATPTTTVAPADVSADAQAATPVTASPSYTG